MCYQICAQTEEGRRLMGALVAAQQRITFERCFASDVAQIVKDARARADEALQAVCSYHELMTKKEG